MILVTNYVGVLSKYVGFGGRATRTEYWLFALVNIIIHVVLGVVGGALSLTAGDAVSILSLVYGLAVFLPSIAVMVRRFHDGGYTGWLGLLLLIPVIGWIVVIVFMILPSERGDNKHGPDPREAVA